MEWIYVVAGVLLNLALLWIFKPWSEAYAGEKAKNFARKEDLDAIVAEVRAVTATAKGIESQLAGDLWHRQMQWNQKKEIYGELLKHFWEMCQAFARLETVIQMETDMSRDKYDHEITAKRADIMAIYNLIVGSHSYARIFLPNEFTTKIALQLLKLRFPSVITEQWATEQREGYAGLINDATESARRELIIDSRNDQVLTSAT